MKKVIHKNCRRPFPFFDFFIPILINKNESYSISKYFKFDKTAIYLIPDSDQLDYNKLFGFSFGMHHNNSFRFGWRPNKTLDKIEIATHEYRDKKMMRDELICEVEIDKWYKYKISYFAETNQIYYNVFDGDKSIKILHDINIKHKFSFGYKLFLYFGGNKKAPQDIIIYQDNE